MNKITETTKAFVTDDDCIVIRCPACNSQACVKVESFRNKCNLLKIRCSCQNVFKVNVDYRRFYRKPTKIAGIFRPINPPGNKGCEILIVNISKDGIGFTVFTGHGIREGDTLQISFELDDKKRTYLQKKVQVQSINKDFVGCRFSDPELFEKALGFYLQN